MILRVIGNPTVFGAVDSLFESRRISDERGHNSVGRVVDF
jgi:hypothetical protein